MLQHNNFRPFMKKQNSYLIKQLFFDSDLALRNCLLTSDMSVKIGDYGLSHSRFKVRLVIKSIMFSLYVGVYSDAALAVFVVAQDDYYVTQDQIWVPLRWIAPELIDEVHGNLLIVDQTKSSNIW